MRYPLFLPCPTVVPARKIKSHGHHHHHHHHQKSETVQQTPMLPAPPQSLFNRPSAALIRMRREAKQQKMRALAGKPVVKPMPVVHRPATIETTSLDKLEWLINEDWALLQVRLVGKNLLRSSGGSFTKILG